MVYCINCDKKVNYIVKERIVDLFIWNLSVRENIIRDIIKNWPTCVEKYAVCKNCGEEIYVSKINDWNVRERLLKRIEIGDLVYTAGSVEEKELNEFLQKLDNKWKPWYYGKSMLDEYDWYSRNKKKKRIEENKEESVENVEDNEEKNN